MVKTAGSSSFNDSSLFNLQPRLYLGGMRVTSLSGLDLECQLEVVTGFEAGFMYGLPLL